MGKLFHYPGAKTRFLEPLTHALWSVWTGNTRTYAEPFVGSGEVLLNVLRTFRPQTVRINDIDPGIAAVWWSVLHAPEALMDSLHQIEPSVPVFREIRDHLRTQSSFPTTEPERVQLASSKIAVHQLTISALGTVSGGPRGGWSQDSIHHIGVRWRPEQRDAQIKDAHRLLSAVGDVEITCTDFQEVLCGLEAGTVAYLDPPYYSPTERLYEYELDVERHHDLAEVLRGAEFEWVLSYDDCPEVRALYDFSHVSEMPVSYASAWAKGAQELILGSKEMSELHEVQLDGVRYRMPFLGLIGQNVDIESLADSINREGLIYPIVYRETSDGREIIDGNTRAFLVSTGRVSLEEVPVERVELKQDDAAHDLAIQLNFQRRQVGGSERRKVIQKIHGRRGWRGKPSSHVKVLAELLGVSKATISKDIAAIWDAPDDIEIREERKRINYLLTGLTYLQRGEIEELDFTDTFSSKEIEIGERYLEAVRDRLASRRKAMNETLK